MEILSLLNLDVNRFLLRYPVDLASTIFAALVLATIATLAVRTTATIIRRHKGGPVSIPHFSLYNDEDGFSSCSSSEDEDNQDDEDEETETDGDGEETHSDRPEESNFWPENGGAIVKAWDGLGLSFQRSTGSGSSSIWTISTYDLSRSENIRSFLAEIPAAINFTTSQSLLLSTTTSVVRVWDARRDGESPVAASELQALRRRKMVGITGGEGGKVYVRDNARERCLQRSSRPPAMVRTWLDADEYVVDNSRTVVSWCRSAAKCLTLLPLSE